MIGRMSTATHETADQGVIEVRVVEWLAHPGERATVNQLSLAVGASMKDTAVAVNALAEAGQIRKAAHAGFVTRWEIV